MKDELPQLHPATGLSQDFLNSFAPILLIRGKTVEDRVYVSSTIRSYPVEHYKDYFGSRGYSPEAVLETEERVKKLDALVDLANELFVNPDNCTPTNLRGVVKSARDLIDGKPVTYKFVREYLEEHQ